MSTYTARFITGFIYFSTQKKIYMYLYLCKQYSLVLVHTYITVRKYNAYILTEELLVVSLDDVPDGPNLINLALNHISFLNNYVQCTYIWLC